MVKAPSKLLSLYFIGTAFVLIPSYVFQSIYNLDVRVLYSGTVLSCMLALVFKKDLRASHELPPMLLCIIMIGLAGTLLSGVDSQLLMALSLAGGVALVWLGLYWYTNSYSLLIINIICVVLLAGGFVGVVYSYIGGAPLAMYYIGDRPILLYLTTYSLYTAGGLMRPSGIFDEPGAFAMYVTSVLAMNEVYSFNKKWSKGIALLSLITGSFAQFILVILYFVLDTGISAKRVLATASVVFVLIFFGQKIEFLDEYAGKFYFNRLEVQDGKLVGDNRTHQVESFFELVTLDIALEGIRVTATSREGHDISSNPFSIFIGYGMAIWLPYAGLQLWLLYCSLGSRRHIIFPSLAMFLTLLQRPYLFNQYWTLIILVVVISIYKARKLDIAESLKLQRQNILNT